MNHDVLTRKGRFVITMRDPINWLFTASSLLKNADTIFAEVPARHVSDPSDPFDVCFRAEPYSDTAMRVQYTSEAQDVFLLLAALALENLFKAGVIKTDPEKYVTDDAKLHAQIRTHDLAALATRANLLGLLTDEERKLLPVLRGANVSWSRYPAGKDPDDGDIGPPLNFDIHRAHQVVHAMFERVRDHIFADVEGDSE